MLAVQSVGKSYGRHRVLSDVTFRLDEWEAVGVVGPNGSGKTTLLRLLVGLMRPDAGTVRLDGHTMPAALRAGGVAYFGGEATLPPHVRGDRWRSLFVSSRSASSGERRPLGALSRGSRQALGLRTVFSLPRLRLIVLDEPWEGLDPDAARWLSAEVHARRNAGACVVVSSHRFHDLAGVCDRYLFLSNGHVSSLTARELAGDSEPVSAGHLFSAFDRFKEAGR